MRNEGGSVCWPPGDGWGIEKEEERDLPLPALLSLLVRWRLPTLPLSQYHRRDEV